MTHERRDREVDHHLRPVKNDREPMTDWKKFALLIFALGAVIAVVIVYMAIRGDLVLML